MSTFAQANTMILGRARAGIAEQRSVFDAFRRAALEADDDRACAALAQAAHRFGWLRHPGIMVAADLERRIGEIGRRYVPGRPAERSGEVRRVLHVATEIYATGGHTRVLERWIERDSGRRPTLMLLGHNGPLPEATAAALRRVGGSVVRPAAGVDALERARHLRALAGLHDLVVLHIHPYDVTPGLAFADPEGRPPTLLFNHASHQCWTGVGASDVVAGFRALDERLTVERRGVAAERSVTLPIPAVVRELPDRAAARAATGLPDDVPVVLSVGSAYKMLPVLQPTFADLCAAVAEAHPRALVVVIGPTPESGVTPDHPRVAAVGATADLAPWLAAADVYLDTWPISGGTATVDAAAAGLPIVALSDGVDGGSLIRPAADDLGGAVLVEPDVESVGRRVAELLEDPARRAEIGERGRAHVADAHAGHGWLAAMEAAVEAAVAHAGEAAPPAAEDPGPVSDAEAVLQAVYEPVNGGYTPEHAYLAASGDLPPEQRPADVAAAQEAVARILESSDEAGGPLPRAVAAPEVTPEAIAAVVARARELVSAGRVGWFVVVVPEPELARAAELLQRELDAGPDIDVELTAGSPAAVTRPGDIELTPAG